MSRAGVRKVDIDRAIAVVEARGLSVAAVEIQRDGTVRIVTEERDLTKRRSRELNGWDHS